MIREEDGQLRQDFGGLSPEAALPATAKMQAEFLSDSAHALSVFGNTPDAESIYGLKSEIEHALALAKKSLAATLQQTPEQALEHLRDAKIITERDFEEALTTRRTLMLAREREQRSSGQER